MQINKVSITSDIIIIAKLAIKSYNITPFGGLYSVLNVFPLPAFVKLSILISESAAPTPMHSLTATCSLSYLATTYAAESRTGMPTPTSSSIKRTRWSASSHALRSSPKSLSATSEPTAARTNRRNRGEGQ